jgi:hypothetical protein
MPSTAAFSYRAYRPIRAPDGSPGAHGASTYQQAFADLSTELVVLGHTHMPFDRLADRRRFVNAGSVGLGYGHSGASWAILGPDVVLRRTPYDADKAAAILTASSDLPGIANMAANVRFPESDAVALDAFTDTVGRQQAN